MYRGSSHDAYRTYSFQSATTRSESVRSCRTRSYPCRAGACPFFDSSSPIRRRLVEPCVRFPTRTLTLLGRFELIFEKLLFFSLPGSDLPAPLASAILEHAVDLPAPPAFDGNQKREEASSTVSAPGSSNRVKVPSGGGEVKIPKWLKLGSSTSLSISRPYPVRNFLLQRSDALHPIGIIKSI
jgi:hypothetical protein